MIMDVVSRGVFIMKRKEKSVIFSHKYFWVVIFVVVLMCFSTDAYAQEVEAKSYDEIKKHVYEAMLKREKSITIVYTGSDMNTINQKFQNKEIYTDVANIDDKSTSDDGVYMMKEAYGGYAFRCQYNNGKTTFSIEFTWKETLEASKYVNEQVKAIVNTTGVLNMNNAYDRAIKLRDYLLSMMTYQSGTNQTVYQGLISKKGNCHVYAMLYYKLLQEAKVDCYYVTGNVSTGWHGWNLVKLDNKWYNIDVTYEDTENNSGKYSCKGKNSMSLSHSLDAEYVTSEFLSKYNISDVDFCKASYIGNDLFTTKIAEPKQIVLKEKDESKFSNKGTTTEKKDENKNVTETEKVEDKVQVNSTDTTSKADSVKKEVCNNKLDSSPETGDTTSVYVIFIIAILSGIILVVSSRYLKCNYIRK